MEGDDDALLPIYVHLMAWAACYHESWLMCAVRPDAPEGEWAEEPSPWALEDFQQAAENIRAAGYFCTADDTGLTAEFPWEDGAPPAMLGGVTSLMTFQSDMRHPQLGSGLFFKLELPQQFTPTQLPGLVNHLNVLELTGEGARPLYGAWCSPFDSGRLAYVGFVPNAAYWPASVSLIGSWLCWRSFHSQAAICDYLEGEKPAELPHRQVVATR